MINSSSLPQQWSDETLPPADQTAVMPERRKALEQATGDDAEMSEFEKQTRNADHQSEGNENQAVNDSATITAHHARTLKSFSPGTSSLHGATPNDPFGGKISDGNDVKSDEDGSNHDIPSKCPFTPYHMQQPTSCAVYTGKDPRSTFGESSTSTPDSSRKEIASTDLNKSFVKSAFEQTKSIKRHPIVADEDTLQAQCCEAFSTLTNVAMKELLEWKQKEGSETQLHHSNSSKTWEMLSESDDSKESETSVSNAVVSGESSHWVSWTAQNNRARAVTVKEGKLSHSLNSSDFAGISKYPSCGSLYRRSPAFSYNSSIGEVQTPVADAPRRCTAPTVQFPSVKRGTKRQCDFESVHGTPFSSTSADVEPTYPRSHRPVDNPPPESPPKQKKARRTPNKGQPNRDGDDEDEDDSVKGRKKGQWTDEEDEQLRRLVEQFGAKNWRTISAKMNGERAPKQCRERWHHHLDPNIKKGAWTPEEDQAIIELKAKHGNRWAWIAKDPRLAGRTDNSIKNRFNSSLKKQNS